MIPRSKLHSVLLIVVFAASTLHAGVAGMPRNGDTNGDGQRDISDAVFLLSWLFLGGSEPVLIVCPELDCAGEAVRLANGDTNGDRNRDVTDVIRLLRWLFLQSGEPEVACSCATFPECDECPSPHQCVPDRGESLVCTADLATCEEVRALHEFLMNELGPTCEPTGECHLVVLDCQLGLGGCYFPAGTHLRQEYITAVEARFRELDCCSQLGLVCLCPPCPPPPEVVDCVDGTCQFSF